MIIKTAFMRGQKMGCIGRYKPSCIPLEFAACVSVFWLKTLNVINFLTQN